MTENMIHWDALKATDPKYTKKVEFGRKFTSINSQWQLQRMTEQFGPVGQGWGYRVVHSIERITDEYVMAVADVTVWTSEPEEGSFGPVRGMSPIVEKGKNGLHFDDDAGKKAMTDALTKALSHLGLSADVFLGLYENSEYVERMRKAFKTKLETPEMPETDNKYVAKEAAQLTKESAIEAVDPADRHLVQGDGRSTYQIAKEGLAPGRTAAEFWASEILLLLKEPGYDFLQYKEWQATRCTPKGTKTNGDRLIEMREKHSDLAQKIDDAASNLRVAA